MRAIFLILCVLFLPAAAAEQPDPAVQHYVGRGLTTACADTPDWQRGWGASWLAGCGFRVVEGSATIHMQDAWSHDVTFRWILYEDNGTVCASGDAIARATIAIEDGCRNLLVTPTGSAAAGQVFVL